MLDEIKGTMSHIIITPQKSCPSTFGEYRRKPAFVVVWEKTTESKRSTMSFRTPLVVRNLVKTVPRRAGHGHAAPSGGNDLPKWIQALEEAPRGQAILGAIGAAIVTSGLFTSIMLARGENKQVVIKNKSTVDDKKMLYSPTPFFLFFIIYFPVFRCTTTHKV